MKITNELNLPDSIVRAVTADSYVRGDADFTVTELLAPTQQLALQRKHADDLVEDASDRLYSLLGQAVHTILERAGTSGIAEVRLQMPVTLPNGEIKTVSGKFDHFTLETGILTDYKIMSIWEAIYGLKPEKIAQLNLYERLLNYNGHEVKGLQIAGLFRDWSKSKAGYGDGHPPKQVQLIPVPLWDANKSDAYLQTAVEGATAAITGTNIAPCTGDDRWEQPTKYALMKKTRQKAVKLADSLELLEVYGLSKNLCEVLEIPNSNEVSVIWKENLTVDVRPGRNTRCEDYCNVNGFCPQFAAITQAAEQT